MLKTKLQYPAEYRQRIADLLNVCKKSPQLSREFGCFAQTIANGVVQAAIDRDRPLPGKDGPSIAGCEELSPLRRENWHVKLERAFFSETTAWFAASVENATTSPSSS